MPRTCSVHLLRAKDFRNYVGLELELGERFNVVAGKNAQGKTNLLEAVHLVATTRLLRGQRDAEAVREGCSQAEVSVTLTGSETQLSVTLAPGVRKRAKINGVSMPRASDLIGRLPCVCISTEDLLLVRGDPSERRLFLDIELSSLYPAYLRHLTLYKRAVDQRNALLKLAREQWVDDATFEPWEEQIAAHGPPIRAARRAFVARLLKHATENHATLGEGESLSLTMIERDEATDVETALQHLTSKRSQDVARGSTSVGPQRDELEIRVAGKEARLYGSQGQQRSAVLAMKVGTLDLIGQELGQAPLLLLDDILSDLDAQRRSNLVTLVLEKAQQAILTCTEAESAGARVLEVATVFKVEAGSATRV